MSQEETSTLTFIMYISVVNQTSPLPNCSPFRPIVHPILLSSNSHSVEAEGASAELEHPQGDKEQDVKEAEYQTASKNKGVVRPSIGCTEIGSLAYDRPWQHIANAGHQRLEQVPARDGS